MMTPILHVKPSIFLLDLDQFPILDQLRLEEALLRADECNWCIINRGISPAIVMGISGVADKLIDFEQMRQNPVQLIRRFSGGGTVFVDSNTIFATMILNTDLQCCPQKIHQQMANFYQEAFLRLGMNLRENDYVIGEKKWGGNAQYLRKGRWLHHTSMLWDYELKNMKYLLMPARVPNYRNLRTHEDFLCRLKDYFVDEQELKENLLKTLHLKFEVKKKTLEEVVKVLSEPHRKATSVLHMT